NFVNCGCFGVLVGTSASQTLDYFGTFRARAGFGAGGFVVYGTAGLAVGHIGLEGSIIPNPSNNPTYVASRSFMQTGYVAGGGVEVAVGGPVSFKAEYLRYDLGERTLVLNETTGLLPTDYATMRFRTSGELVRAGINVRFGNWASSASGGASS